MKHGPIALIDKEMPVVIIATKDNSYEKIVSNIQEVKARKGQVIAIVTEGDELIASMADHVLEVPATSQLLMPLDRRYSAATLVVPHCCDARMQRRPAPQLAKSVTVE